MRKKKKKENYFVKCYQSLAKCFLPDPTIQESYRKCVVVEGFSLVLEIFDAFEDEVLWPEVRSSLWHI